MKLRYYQQECVDSIISNYALGITKQLVVLPTGSGKTVIMAAVLKELNQTALVLSHRREIVNQTIKTIKMFSHVEPGVLMGKTKNLEPDIVVGSIQSCNERFGNLKQLINKKFHILIIDEAHHSSSDTYKKIINTLDYDLLLGFTATPNLANGNTLGDIYEKTTYSKQIEEMIKEDHLSDVVGRKIKTDVELKYLRVKNGDYLIPELAKLINTIARNNLIVEKYKEHIKNGRTLAFCATVNHAENLSKAFINAGIKANFIHGELHINERTQILSDFKNGTIEVLTSVSILIEGFDMPEINTIIMARPTRSRSLYIQMVGRGLRKIKDKTKCTVLDFIDINHNLKQSISLDIAVPYAKIDSDIEIGDRCKVNYPSFVKEFDEKINKIFDIKLNLVDKNVNKLPENKEINERSKRASDSRTIKFQKGELCGLHPYGYEPVWSKDGKKAYQIKKTEADILRFAYNTYINKSYTFSKIIEKIKTEFKNTIGLSSLMKILDNPFYYGYMRADNKLYPHIYEPIITEETFNEFQRIKKIKTTKKAFVKKEFLYRGILKCNYCGCSLCGDLKKEKYIYYRCSQAKEKHGAVSFKEETINDYVINLFQNTILIDSTMQVVLQHFKDIFKDKGESWVKSYLYYLTHKLPSLFMSAEQDEKIKILKMLFNKISIDENNVKFDLKTIFKDMFLIS